jgi:hypothetical protein
MARFTAIWQRELSDKRELPGERAKRESSSDTPRELNILNTRDMGSRRVLSAM